ncbi:MAG: hypothetical protein RL385_2430 [Pseudomonadota bacterium]
MRNLPAMVPCLLALAGACYPCADPYEWRRCLQKVNACQAVLGEPPATAGRAPSAESRTTAAALSYSGDAWHDSGEPSTGCGNRVVPMAGGKNKRAGPSSSPCWILWRFKHGG